jgi:hypothetical protein
MLEACARDGKSALATVACLAAIGSARSESSVLVRRSVLGLCPERPIVEPSVQFAPPISRAEHAALVLRVLRAVFRPTPTTTPTAR